MTVRLHDARTFDVSAATLYALFTDPAFQEARSRHLGTLEARCRRIDRGGVTELVLEERRDTGWEPHVFASRHTTIWDPASRSGRWTLEQTGGPGDASASGTIAIEAQAGRGCRLVLEGRLTVRVPIFGRMIEGIAKRALVHERAEEAAFVRRALAERASG